MAKKVVGGLVAKLGIKARQAVEAHKSDETKFSGGGDLPAGIENGIAQLTSCKFGVYEKGDMQGEFYFTASGIVVSPTTISVDGTKVPVKGLRTTIGPEPIADTPNRSRKTIDDHIAWVLNEMRKLGVDTSELSAEDLESTAQALVELAPHFRFRTWAGEATKDYPNPRTNHDWRGVVEDFDSDSIAESEDEELVDNTDEEVEEAEEVEAVEEEEEQDWDALAKLADKDDEEAASTLQEKALELGVKQSVIDKAMKWTQISKLIKEKLAPAEEEEEEEEEESTEESIDYSTLGESADEGDEDAMATLTSKAEEHEIDPNAYATWAELGTAISELEVGSTEEVTEESEESEEEEEEESEEEESEESEGEDLAQVGTLADEGDEEAMARLTELAEESEVDPNDYATWAELADALTQTGEEEAEEEEEEEAEEESEEEEEVVPTKGDVYNYRPKGAKKPIEVEVQLVGKGTVTLLNLDDKKTTYKMVPFSDLINQ